MVDDRREPHEPSGGGESGADRDGDPDRTDAIPEDPDATTTLPPPSDADRTMAIPPSDVPLDETSVIRPPDDQTMALPSHPDQTAALPSADQTTALPPHPDQTAPIPSRPDETVALPTDPDRTTAMPAASDGMTTVGPAIGGLAGADRTPWAGRAGVPPPKPPVRGAVPDEDWGPDDHPGAGGRWWMPILLGLVALLLIGALAYGIWLILDSRDDGPTTPVPTQSTATAPVTSAVPTSAAATSFSPAPTTAGPEMLSIPAVVGLSQQAAQAKLDATGLAYRVQFEPSDESEGTVIRVEPDEGVRVPADSVVVLVIAQARETTPTTPTATPESESPSPDQSTGSPTATP
jgi:hypothetical protein